MARAPQAAPDMAFDDAAPLPPISLVAAGDISAGEPDPRLAGARLGLLRRSSAAVMIAP